MFIKLIDRQFTLLSLVRFEVAPILEKHFQESQKYFLLAQKSSSSCGLHPDTELLCIVLCDVSITPNVEMMLFGLLHRIVILFHHLGELSASLLVH